MTLEEEMAKKKSGAKAFVESDPKVCGGNPVIAGTRTPTKLVYDFVTAGASLRQLASDYGVTVAAIQAAVEFEKSRSRRKTAAKS